MEQRLGEGMSEAAYFGQVVMLIDDKETKEKLEKDILPYLRLLPSKEAFTKTLNGWCKSIKSELAV